MNSKDIDPFALVELARTDCFLCRPSSKLLADVVPGYFTMAGLGPLTPAYTIIATAEHLDQLKDEATIQGFAQYIEYVRGILAKEYGSCLLTEHGHSPLCTLANSQNIHCYHPHVLLFPGAPNIITEADEYFSGKGRNFDTLAAALRCGIDLSQYLLVSENSSSYFVYSAPTGMPRQFARALVAEAQGNIDLASWRNHPAIDKAQANADFLKKLLCGDDSARVI